MRFLRGAVTFPVTNLWANAANEHRANFAKAQILMPRDRASLSPNYTPDGYCSITIPVRYFEITKVQSILPVIVNSLVSCDQINAN